MSTRLELKAVSRNFAAGECRITALDGINLSIAAGEMLAIMGPSGSGKSTLMNILGCLDLPSSGSYQIDSSDVAQMSPATLAQLRRDHFGFVFQSYHLLPGLTALGNVEMPAIYRGTSSHARRIRATALLTQLGLEHRTQHKPAELSGGQRQRVSIARALMNGGEVLLADEPTGALDQASGHEVMGILRSLHRQGHTVIVVTHDPQVAAYADRVITLRDGRIVADTQTQPHTLPASLPWHPPPTRNTRWAQLGNRLMDAANMAIGAMRGHRLRTVLTMLGIIIGVASVISVAGLGAGARQSILDNINGLGTNTIDIFPGGGPGERDDWNKQSLRAGDMNALEQLAYVDSVTPEVKVNAGMRYRQLDMTANITGVGEQFFHVHGGSFLAGHGFDAETLRLRSQEAVIDSNARAALFPDGTEPLGQIILLGPVPVRIVGVLSRKSGFFDGRGQANIWLPYTTVLTRFTGRDYLNVITVRVKDQVAMDAAATGVTRLMTQRHGKTDFYLQNNDELRKTLEKQMKIMTLTISSIALIALIVGGIGVMNIMLVSVSERTREIGVRMAVGATQGDIMRQFLIEAVLVCLLGGLLGLGLAFGTQFVFNTFVNLFSMELPLGATLVALGMSSLIGIGFGFMPARRAAKLNPVEALSGGI